MLRAPTTTIRPLLSEHLDQAVGLLRDSYSWLQAAGKAGQEYYAWKYLDLAGRDTGLPSAFVAEEGGRVVGFLGCLPFRLEYQGGRIRAGWVADWRLAASARGRGIGAALLRTAMESVPALACMNGSDEARRLFERFGFQAWDCGRDWVRISDPLGYEWPRRRGVRKLAGLARAVQHVVRSVPEIRSATTFGAVCLSGAVAPADVGTSLPCERQDGMVRDGEYVRWILRCPVGDTSFHRLIRSEQEVGYVLLHAARDRLGRRRGRVLDVGLCAEAQAYVADAWAASADYLQAVNKASYVDGIAPNRWADGLGRAGFRPAGSRRLWLKTNAFSCNQQEAWNVSLIDKDNAFRGSEFVP